MDGPIIPAGLVRVRTTPELTETTVPAGLRSAHRIAAGVWGRLRVLEGTLRFVAEGDPSLTIDLRAGEHVDIAPGLAHHVEPGPDGRFVIDFYR